MSVLYCRRVCACLSSLGTIGVCFFGSRETDLQVTTDVSNIFSHVTYSIFQDMAFGLQETSRLGCQITVTESMEGVTLEMPKATRNFYVDGHVPQPH